MISTQTLKGNLVLQDYTTAFTLNQGDKGVPFRIELLENGTSYTLLSTDTVSIEWLKPNGKPFLQDGDIIYGTNYIEIITPEAVAQYSGTGTFNIIIADGTVRKGTIRREYKVIPTSMKPDSVSEDVITDALTELRELNSTLASTIQTGNLDNYAKKTYVNKEVELINSSLEEKASKETTQNIQVQIDNLVLGAVGDGNNPEVIQARGEYDLLNSRLDDLVPSKDAFKLTLTDKKYVIREPMLSYNSASSLNSDGTLNTLVSTESHWRVSDYINIENSYVVAEGCGSTNNSSTVYVMALYDKDKNLVKIIEGDKTDSSISSFKYSAVTFSTKNTDIKYLRISGNFIDDTTYRRESTVVIYSEVINSRIDRFKIPTTKEYLTDLFDDRTKIDFKKGYRLDENGNDFADGDWVVSDFIPVDQRLIVRGYSYSRNRVAIATYDKYKQLKYVYNGDTYYKESSYDDDFYYKELDISSEDCEYVKIVGSINYGLTHTVKECLSLDVAIEDIKENLNIKKENDGSSIFFSVNVNQNFADITNINTTIQDSETFLPVNCALVLPSSYSSTGKPCKIAVVMHGAGGVVTSTDVGEMAGFSDLVDNGYAVFDVNGSNNNYTSSAEHMGSSRTLSAYLKAFEWIKENYNVEDKLYVHGHSMGGLTAINFARQNPSICKVLGIYHPVTDLYNQAWLNPWLSSTKVSIATEYNFTDKTGATYEEDKVVGFNPIENDYLPCPCKIWHGNADTTVSLSGTQAFVEKLKQNGIRVDLRILDGIGHGHTNTMYKELTMWFNRF